MNDLKRMHWSKYARIRRRIAKRVAVATHGKRPPIPFQRVRIDVVRHGRGALDEDNLPTCAKLVLDVLQPLSKRCPNGLGVILGDDPDRCALTVTQQVDRRAAVRMTVRIEELP